MEIIEGMICENKLRVLQSYSTTSINKLNKIID